MDLDYYWSCRLLSRIVHGMLVADERRHGGCAARGHTLPQASLPAAVKRYETQGFL